MDRGDSLFGRFLTALPAHEWDELAGCFSEGARLRALVPAALQDPSGPADIAKRFRDWFGATTDFEIVSSRVEEIADRTHLSYRLHFREDGVWYWCEQQAYCRVDESGRIDLMNLVCSGFRPEFSEQA